MRLRTVAASIGMATAAPAAACGIAPGACPEIVIPLFTLEGVRVGTVRAGVEPSLPLAVNPYTGQPMTVSYGTPDRPPGWTGPRSEGLPHPRESLTPMGAVDPRDE